MSVVFFPSVNHLAFSFGCLHLNPSPFIVWFYGLIIFDNDEQKQFDVKPYIKGSWFGKLNDDTYFKTVNPTGYTIEWADGQDICPDDLYFNSY